MGTPAIVGTRFWGGLGDAPGKPTTGVGVGVGAPGAGVGLGAPGPGVGLGDELPPLVGVGVGDGMLCGVTPEVVATIPAVVPPEEDDAPAAVAPPPPPPPHPHNSPMRKIPRTIHAASMGGPLSDRLLNFCRAAHPI